MIEALAVLVGVALLGLLGVVLPMVPSAWLVQGGIACAAAGLLLGVPTGFWYHVELRRSLLRRGPLPERWWLRPALLHDRLPERERLPVLAWFYAGGAGFLATIAGCTAALAGVFLEAVRAGVL